uniref:Uncharacterized protein n=1 Tax=Anopheles minimus TaxID=112268 RepID=A0A182WP06_9DIPT
MLTRTFAHIRPRVARSTSCAVMFTVQCAASSLRVLPNRRKTLPRKPSHRQQKNKTKKTTVTVRKQMRRTEPDTP